MNEPTTTARRSSTDTQEETRRIRLTIGGQEATAPLDDNAASRELFPMLPVTVPMGDLFDRESRVRCPGR